MDTLQLVFFVLIIIPSAILHEYAHAWMADRLGDPTPRLAGRLTINPVPHIDPWGTLFLPFLLFFITSGQFLFAYAKPVPFNPYALRNQKYGSGLVGLAGPASNLILAFAIGLVVRFIPNSTFSNFLSVIVYANILLAVFNLVPIPPLDGSKIMYTLLPDKWIRFKIWLEQYGLIFLIMFMIFLFPIINPIIEFIFQLAIG